MLIFEYTYVYNVHLFSIPSSISPLYSASTDMHVCVSSNDGDAETTNAAEQNLRIETMGLRVFGITLHHVILKYLEVDSRIPILLHNH